jgi:3-hydroxy-5-methyl-1-naphthoate 3-O-methyltransferase
MLTQMVMANEARSAEGASTAAERLECLPNPSADLGSLTERLGQAWGVSCGQPLAQYLAWSEQAGIFAVGARRDSFSIDALRAGTPLNDAGIDALVAILASLDLVRRERHGTYCLTRTAREYLVPDSPYYVGDGLYHDCEKPLPAAFLREPFVGGGTETGSRWTIETRLRIQHSRNFAPNVVAARSGRFERVRHLLDVGGGSGTFAIPLVLDRSETRVTLVDLPDSVDQIRSFLNEYGVADRIDVIGRNVFTEEWTFPSCDSIFFGNVFHSSSDDACRFLLAKSFDMLPPGGQVALHEVLFDEDRCGPLIAALWNANMVVRSPGGKQRTASELTGMLWRAGFCSCRVTPTAAGFSLVTAVKPLTDTPG